MAIGFGVVGAAWFAGRGDPPTAVVALARDVRRGDQLTAMDFERVNLNVDNPLDAVLWNKLDSLLDRRVLLDLRAGTLVTPRMVTETSAIPIGMATVGLLLDPGGYPSASMAPGDHVQIVRTPKAADANAEVVVGDAEIYRVAELDNTSGDARFVTLLVPVNSAPAVASAAAAGEARLIGLE